MPNYLSKPNKSIIFVSNIKTHIMTPEKLAFKEARETYRGKLIHDIEQLLQKVPENTQIKLISTTSETGIATGDYTDVMDSINCHGYGLVFNNTDLDNYAFGGELQYVVDIFDINGLEEVIQSIKQVLVPRMLSNDEIAKAMLSDLASYSEFIQEIIVDNLSSEGSTKKIYWDAWFRGANGKDLENAEKGIIYKK